MFRVIVIILLVISFQLLGMFWSFKAGGFKIATDCDILKGFYHNGKVYICVRKQPYKGKPLTPDMNPIPKKQTF